LKNERGFEKPASVVPTSDAKLYQNSPNPFDTNTEIKFYIPTGASAAMIVVFDMTGRDVLKFNVTDREHSSIIINANQLQSGMYLYTLIVDGLEISSHKMILLGK
jgi:hypothetical protein